MKANMVKEAYNALAVNNRESFGNYVSVESVKLNTDRYTFDVWVYITGSSGDIISQEKGIRMGIENEMFYFYHPSIGQKTVRPVGPKPEKKQWLNLLVSFDGRKAAFALNGVPAGEIACSGASLIENEVIRLGCGLQGYIRSFRCYDCALPEDKYKQYVFETVCVGASMTALRAFMDFSKEDMPDISGHGVKAVTHGSCGVMNLVPVYLPSKGKYASVNLGDEINLGGFASGAFSLYIKTYLRPSVKERQVLASNGNFGEGDAVLLYAKTKDEQVQLALQMGAVSVDLGAPLSVFQWVDVLITYDREGLAAYINGTAVTADISFAKRTRRGEFRLGNGFDQDSQAEDLTCEHYLFIAAVFDRKLNQADGDSFLQNHPYLFEEGLVALFSFTSIPAELLTARPIHLDEDDVILAQRTLDRLPASPYDYRVNGAQACPSDMRRWKAESIWAGLVAYCEALGNLVPVLQEDQKQAVIGYIASDKELLRCFAPLFATFVLTGEVFAQCLAKVPPEKLAGLLRAGRFVGVNTAGASASAATGGAGVLAEGMSLAAGAIPGLAETGKDIIVLFEAATSVISLILSLAAQAIKGNRKKKPDRDDDDDKDISLTFSSISFQHDPDDYRTSAVRCRTYQGSVTAPEWTSAKRDRIEAVYIADKMQNVKVKFKFTITDKSKKPKPSYDVSIRGDANSSAVFEKLEYSAKGLAAGVEYEGAFTVTKNNLSCRGIACQDLELWWSYTVNKETDTMANTKVSLYFIPTTPVAPIYLDQQHAGSSVPLELVQLFSEKVTDLPVREGTDVNFETPEKLRAYTDELYRCQVFEYDPNAHPFVKVCDLIEKSAPHINHGTADILDEKAMLCEIANYNTNPDRGKKKANCNIYACLLCYRFSLHGVYSTVSIIESGTPGVPLLTKELMGAGAAAGRSYQFRYHAIVRVPSQAAVAGSYRNTYYDGCCKPMSGEVLAGLEFRSDYWTPLVQATEAGTYRGKVFKRGTAAVEASNRLFVLSNKYRL